MKNFNLFRKILASAIPFCAVLRPRSLAPLVALAFCMSTAQGANGFNVDFGTKYGPPTPSYGAAASQPGKWNVIRLGPTSLFDSTGVLTGTTVNVMAENAGGNFSTPLPTTDIQFLLNDNFFTSGGTSWSADIANLADGDYLVILYAPSNPQVTTGQMTVGTAVLASIPGGISAGLLIEGLNWTSVSVTVSGGVLPISGTDPSFCGLAGLQIMPIVSPFVNYCTAGTTASGCQAILSGSGTPSATSATGFDLIATTVEGGKDGLYFMGTSGKQANTWGSGTSFQCVNPPVKRAGLLIGTGTPGLCDGAFSQDINARWTANSNQNPGAGAVVQAQLWFRDPLNTSNQTTSLSDALEFVVQP